MSQRSLRVQDGLVDDLLNLISLSDLLFLGVFISFFWLCLFILINLQSLRCSFYCCWVLVVFLESAFSEYGRGIFASISLFESVLLFCQSFLFLLGVVNILSGNYDLWTLRIPASLTVVFDGDWDHALVETCAHWATVSILLLEYLAGRGDETLHGLLHRQRLPVFKPILLVFLAL